MALHPLTPPADMLHALNAKQLELEKVALNIQNGFPPPVVEMLHDVIAM